MADDKVTVQALEQHTNQGKAYDVGETYEVDRATADSLVVQGKAAPVLAELKARAANTAKAAKAAPRAAVKQGRRKK